jgi:hypothetical protein
MGKTAHQKRSSEMSQATPAGAQEPNEKPPLPESARGLCWGAFLLSWIWAIFNRTWLGLLCLIPGVGFVMQFVLLFKGREWAWKNKKWESVERFNRVQRHWSIAGLLLTIIFPLVFGVLAAIAMPNFMRYQAKAQQSEAKIHLTALLAGEKAWQTETASYTSDLGNLGLDPSSLTRYKIGFANTDPELAEHCPSCVAGKDAFKAVAVGRIGSDKRLDVWTIDQDRQLTNLVDGTQPQQEK